MSDVPELPERWWPQIQGWRLVGRVGGSGMFT